MTTEPVSVPPQTSARRSVARLLLTILGVIVGVLLYCLCQGVFAGYPKYHTHALSLIGLVLVCLTGGVAWVLDERRIDDDE